jgi:hypothetical protein
MMNNMKLIISNRKIGADLGFRILKTRTPDYSQCKVVHPYLEEVWDSTQPLTFGEIALIGNIEERRVAFQAFGTERLLKEVNPVLVDRKVLHKTVNWINGITGKKESKEVDDTYEIWRVDHRKLEINERRNTDYFFLKCWCTSSGREYIIWLPQEFKDAVEAVAWTFTTNLKEEAIEKIIRQGDCILFKVKGLLLTLIILQIVT